MQNDVGLPLRDGSVVAVQQSSEASMQPRGTGVISSDIGCDESMEIERLGGTGRGENNEQNEQSLHSRFY